MRRLDGYTGSAQVPDRVKTEKGGIFYEEDVSASRSGLHPQPACSLQQQAHPDGTGADGCSSDGTGTDRTDADGIDTDRSGFDGTCFDRARRVPRSADALSTSSGAPVLFPVSDISELSPLFPGLEEISFRQVSGGLSPVTGAPDEVVLLEVENSADVQKVVDILQKAVDEGAAESVGTDAAITAAWKDNASITTDGNYICLAVFMNGVSIPAEFMLP